GDVIALEAKVREWSRALHQAGRYGAWADLSIAVLRHLPKDRRPPIELARLRRVGLAVGDQLIVEAQRRDHDMARRLWTSEHVIAALDGHGARHPRSRA